MFFAPLSAHTLALTKNFIKTSAPIFNSVAYPIKSKMDKISVKGKAGQALFDKPGQHYGGENLVVAMIRKVRATMRAIEAKSYKIAPL